jgi:hypothetical protein
MHTKEEMSMKEKIKSFGKAVIDFIKDYWVNILVAIIAAFLGAAVKTLIDKGKVKSYTYGESFGAPDTVYDPSSGYGILDSLAGWKIRLDTIGNKIVSAGLETSWFGTDEQNVKCTTKYSVCSTETSNDYLDFDYNKHNA